MREGGRGIEISPKFCRSNCEREEGEEERLERAWREKSSPEFSTNEYEWKEGGSGPKFSRSNWEREEGEGGRNEVQIISKSKYEREMSGGEIQSKI